VAYIPFPFPHTQLTTFYVIVINFFLPILMLTFVPDRVVAAILNFLTAGVFVGLWHVSNELEDPFRNVPNDLPLNRFQAEFNEALLVMFAGFHPEAWWDIADEKGGITALDLEIVPENSKETLQTPSRFGPTKA
jgi:predicted membrane chloride channel (bestrophin family)